MSMIPMKRLHAVIPHTRRDTLLKRLMLMGCVEITESPDFPETDLCHREPGLSSDASEQLSRIKAALESLSLFCGRERKSLFAPLRPVAFRELDDEDRILKIVGIADSINLITKELDVCKAETEGIQMRRTTLLPWLPLDIPLDAASTGRTAVLFGSCPAATDTEALQKQMSEKAPEAFISFVSSDQGQHYLCLLYHRSGEASIAEILKDAGFTAARFSDFKGTAQANLLQCNRRLDQITENQNRLIRQLQDFRSFQQDLELCFDALSVRIHREDVHSRLLLSSRTVILEGWVPDEQVSAVIRELDALGCAFEFTSPSPEEEPPVMFRNSGLTSPFSIISNLYGTPRYGSVIDPTPFMAPFFFIFFGMMVSDAAYGMILALVSLWALRQLRQDGFLKQLFRLVLYCGISTMIWGILFGSWFGDIVPAVSEMLTGKPVTIRPLLVDPLKQPMEVLALSFALGGIQILSGLGLSAVRKIRTGKWLDALLDEGLWYLILLGLVMAFLKFPVGLQAAAVGAAGVILTAGRSEKNPIKRIFSGILSLYKVTGYLSDVLSYSRLLALGLASGVIASVINSMGTIGGNSLGGIIALIVIFLFGHAFNLAINLVGAYVHASRLQYVEFFSKFYESGGKPFAPFSMETMFVTITKEE